MACGNADIMIWNNLELTNCTYRTKAEDQKFCRSTENVTGLCNRKSCPLANSQYATTRIEKGKIILMMKSPERVHTPAKMWEKIILPEDPVEANKIIDEQLQYWDEWLIDKVKIRYGRILETLDNMRIMKQAPKVKDLPIKNKQEKRNKAREERALSVAHVEYTVKEELKNRLKNGVYGEIYNLDAKEFNDALDEFAEPVEFIDESDLEEEIFEYENEEEEKAELVQG